MNDPEERSPGSNHGGNRLPRDFRDGSGERRRTPRLDTSPLAGSVVELDVPTTFHELADALSLWPAAVLRVAFRELGFGAVNIRSELDAETAVRLARAVGVELRPRD